MPDYNFYGFQAKLIDNDFSSHQLTHACSILIQHPDLEGKYDIALAYLQRVKTSFFGDLRQYVKTTDSLAYKDRYEPKLYSWYQSGSLQLDCICISGISFGLGYDEIEENIKGVLKLLSHRGRYDIVSVVVNNNTMPVVKRAAVNNFGDKLINTVIKIDSKCQPPYTDLRPSDFINVLVSNDGTDVCVTNTTVLLMYIVKNNVFLRDLQFIKENAFIDRTSSNYKKKMEDFIDKPVMKPKSFDPDDIAEIIEMVSGVHNRMSSQILESYIEEAVVVCEEADDGDTSIAAYKQFKYDTPSYVCSILRKDYSDDRSYMDDVDKLQSIKTDNYKAFEREMNKIL